MSPENQRKLKSTLDIPVDSIMVHAVNQSVSPAAKKAAAKTSRSALQSLNPNDSAVSSRRAPSERLPPRSRQKKQPSSSTSSSLNSSIASAVGGARAALSAEDSWRWWAGSPGVATGAGAGPPSPSASFALDRSLLQKEKVEDEEEEESSLMI